jgi:hypothetical protein
MKARQTVYAGVHKGWRRAVASFLRQEVNFVRGSAVRKGRAVR